MLSWLMSASVHNMPTPRPPYIHTAASRVLPRFRGAAAVADRSDPLRLTGQHLLPCRAELLGDAGARPRLTCSFGMLTELGERVPIVDQRCGGVSEIPCDHVRIGSMCADHHGSGLPREFRQGSVVGGDDGCPVGGGMRHHTRRGE